MKSDSFFAKQQKKAVIYARYSSHAQNEQSIDGQLRVCHEFAVREGITVIGEYIDRAISGRTDDRPEFQRMIKDAKKKAFSCVIVYKLDRFTRNRYDSAIYKHELKKYGVKVLSAMENIGDNPESVILEAILEASAEYYSIDLSQKIRRGRQDSAKQGKFIGGGIPTGYKSVGGKLVIDENKAPAIKYAFEQYAKGTPKKRIMEELNARGLRNKNGNPYGASAFQKALRCEKYIGILEQAGIRIENGCPALIDEETFRKVQDMLDKNRHTGAANKAKVDYWLSGKIYCGHCGSAMQGTAGTGKGGIRWYYYSCRKRRAKECDKKHEQKEALERYVVEQTIAHISVPERIKHIAASVVALYNDEFNDTRIKEIERRIEKLDRDIRKLVDMAVDVPKAGLQPLYDKMEQYGAEKDDLEIDLAKLRVANKIRYTENDLTVWLKAFCEGEPDDPRFIKRIVDVFINSVYVYDDKIIIYYNVPGGKPVTYENMLESVSELESGGGGTAVDSVRILNSLLHQPNVRTAKRNVASWHFCI